MRRVRWPTSGALVAVVLGAVCLVAACSTQIGGRATAASGSPAGATTSPRETAREPATTTRSPATTTGAQPSTSDASTVCSALDGAVPPTIVDVNAFITALGTPDPADDTTTATTAVGVIGSTVGTLGTALRAPGVDPAGKLATAVTRLDDGLTRVATAITASDASTFNTAIDDVNASYDTARSLCATI